MPTGVLNDRARISNFGCFDICLSSKFYCLIKADIASVPGEHILSEVVIKNRHFAIGACLPSVCMFNESLLILNKIYSKANIQMSKILSTSSQENFNKWSNFQITTVILVVTYAAIVSICTAYESLTSRPHSQLLRSFSLVSNGQMLSRQRVNSQFSCLDGVKMFCIFQVIATHSIRKKNYWAQANPEDYCDVCNQNIFFWLNGAQVAVDTFLLISGLLVSYQFIEERRKR